MSPEIHAALDSPAVLARVVVRLEELGAIRDRLHFDALCLAELDLLVRREVGMHA